MAVTEIFTSTYALPRRVLACLSLFILCMPGQLSLSTASAESESRKVLSETHWGLVTTTFQTPHGSIQVNLPDDLAAGDTISGTILIDPKGQSEEDIKTSANALNKHTLAVDDGSVQTSTSVNDGDFLLTLPNSTNSVRLVLQDQHGHAVESQEVPLTGRAAAPSNNRFIGPICGESGRPFAMVGPFDGTLGSTHMKIAGKELTKLAKSPRKLVLLCPPDLAGPAEVVWTEKGTEMHWHFNSIQLAFDGQSNSVRSGQNLPIRLLVRGAQGLTKPVYVTLENKTPGVVQLGGGNMQHLLVAHDVDFNLTVQGLRHGVFGLAAYLR